MDILSPGNGLMSSRIEAMQDQLTSKETGVHDENDEPYSFGERTPGIRKVGGSAHLLNLRSVFV